MNKGEEHRPPPPEKPDPAPAEETPRIVLHDPFSRFEFEPTDGGDF